MALLPPPQTTFRDNSVFGLSDKITSNTTNTMHMGSTITLGYVENCADPEQIGRLKVYCPSVDSEFHSTSELPWARYVAPFAGITENINVGPNGDKCDGIWGYGLWAIPKVGSHVLVMFLDGNPNLRMWMGGVFPRPFGSTLPAGNMTNLEGQPGQFGEDMYSNRVAEGQQIASGLKGTTIYNTRGGYERQVGSAVNDGAEGYGRNPNNPEFLDPQTYCWTTPGRHFITMCDVDDNCRMRFKTTTGHQIIMDDTNERIYISTGSGGSWIEMDSDGHVHVHSDQSISMNADADINLNAKNNVNIKAGSAVNVKAGASVNISSCCINSKSTSGTYIESGNSLHLLADLDFLASGQGGANIHSKNGHASMTGQNVNFLSFNGMRFTGKRIDINGPKASEALTPDGALDAQDPGIVPSHEPWNRPIGKKKRNKKWKP